MVKVSCPMYLAVPLRSIQGQIRAVPAWLMAQRIHSELSGQHWTAPWGPAASPLGLSSRAWTRRLKGLPACLAGSLALECRSVTCCLACCLLRLVEGGACVSRAILMGRGCGFRRLSWVLEALGLQEYHFGGFLFHLWAFQIGPGRCRGNG